MRETDVTKLHDILRLSESGVLTGDGIARQAGVSTGTVSNVMSRARAAGLSWPLPDGMGPLALKQALYPPQPGRRPDPARHEPDFADLVKALRSGRGRRAPRMTREALWDAYCGEAESLQLKPYSRSRFYGMLKAHLDDPARDPEMRFDYEPGAVMLADFSGKLLQLTRPATVIKDEESRLPGLVRKPGLVLLEQIARPGDQITALDEDLAREVRDDQDVTRVMTIPSVGPVTAMAFQAFAPSMENVRVWRRLPGLARACAAPARDPEGRRGSGRVSKMGQRDLRRLLITCAMAVVRHAVRRGEAADPWLCGMSTRKPIRLVATALANTMRASPGR